VTLKAAVAEQAPRYGDIRAPVVVITGDTDKTVSPTIHSRPFAAALPDAKLIVLPDVGHIVQNAAPALVAREVDAMIARIAQSMAAAAN
jgi:pimeloyl-ACP methyl ester carboxylesterase